MSFNEKRVDSRRKVRNCAEIMEMVIKGWCPQNEHRSQALELLKDIIIQAEFAIDSPEINVDMTRHAAREHGLPHWRCTSLTSNEYWERKDGLKHRCTFAKAGGYPKELRVVDARHPMAEAMMGVDMGEGKSFSVKTLVQPPKPDKPEITRLREGYDAPVAGDQR